MVQKAPYVRRARGNRVRWRVGIAPVGVSRMLEDPDRLVKVHAGLKSCHYGQREEKARAIPIEGLAHGHSFLPHVAQSKWCESQWLS